MCSSGIRKKIDTEENEESNLNTNGFFDVCLSVDTWKVWCRLMLLMPTTFCFASYNVQRLEETAQRESMSFFSLLISGTSKETALVMSLFVSAIFVIASVELSCQGSPLPSLFSLSSLSSPLKSRTLIGLSGHQQKSDTDEMKWPSLNDLLRQAGTFI